MTCFYLCLEIYKSECGDHVAASDIEFISSLLVFARVFCPAGIEIEN